MSAPATDRKRLEVIESRTRMAVCWDCKHTVDQIGGEWAHPRDSTYPDISRAHPTLWRCTHSHKRTPSPLTGNPEYDKELVRVDDRNPDGLCVAFSPLPDTEAEYLPEAEENLLVKSKVDRIAAQVGKPDCPNCKGTGRLPLTPFSLLNRLLSLVLKPAWKLCPICWISFVKDQEEQEETG